MSALKNSKHEAFARAIVGGKSNREAYRGAGYAPSNDNAADAAASRLLADVKVAARVDELKKAAADATVMEAREVLRKLTEIGRASISDFMTIGRNGETRLDLAGAAKEALAAVGEIEFDVVVIGRGKKARAISKVKKFKLIAKTPALELLGKHHGIFVERHEHSGRDGKPIETKDLTERPSELEVARRILFMLEKAARAKKPAPAPAKKE
jgi:phage terminase small subunit